MIICYYLLFINIFSLAAVFSDKKFAQRKLSRIPEKYLFLLALILGSPGVFAGMQLFRHKTKKTRFYIGIPLIFFLQLVIGIYLYLRYAEVI